MKKLKLFVLIALFFSNGIIPAQVYYDDDPETITGIFDGFDGEYYIFDSTDDEDITLFANAKLTVLEKIDLKNEKYIGKTFNITFITESQTEIDEDGDEQEYYIRTIIDLELLD